VFKFILAAAAAFAVAAVAYGAAATLTVNGGTIQVGSDSTVTCDSDGISTTFDVNDAGTVTAVEVGGISSVCATNRLIVSIYGGSTLLGGGGKCTSGCGAPGDPFTVQVTTLFTSLNSGYNCDSTNCKIAVGSDSGGLGIDGSQITSINVMIEGPVSAP
jgi:hypothetical protein